MLVSENMKMTRSSFLLALAGAGAGPLASQEQQRPKMYKFDRKELTVEDFDASGYVLDIGGGGEGIIGRMKGQQVVAIDLYKRELLESPPGPLKIIMDATDLKFLDGSFDTLTAFYSLMYMNPETQRKAFAEAVRVMKPGARWLIWDAIIPTVLDPQTAGPVFYFNFKLPKETVRTGYGTLWPKERHDLSYYKALAEGCGLRVAAAQEQESVFSTFFMELRKTG
jgi:SAM-dependent methyltransferase